MYFIALWHGIHFMQTEDFFIFLVYSGVFDDLLEWRSLFVCDACVLQYLARKFGNIDGAAGNFEKMGIPRLSLLLWGWRSVFQLNGWNAPWGKKL